MSERCLGVDGVPADDGVGDQGEAFTFEVLVVVVSAADLAVVGIVDLASEGVREPRDETKAIAYDDLDALWARRMYEHRGWRHVPGPTLPNDDPTIVDVLYERTIR